MSLWRSTTLSRGRHIRRFSGRLLEKLRWRNGGFAARARIQDITANVRGDFMKGVGQVNAEMAERYFALFVNRLAYTLQSMKPGANGKHYYYRPKQDRRLSLQTLRKHLNGQLTVGLYALNPTTQRSKWVAIDADYENALEDLLKLQWELGQDGVEAALEKSRRGAHLWIFADKPLLARHCRIYIYNLALRLKVPVKGGGSGLAAGIEVFPRQ